MITSETDKKLLIIGHQWPEPDSSAAGRRMMQLIGFFLESGWQITFASTAAESTYAFPLESMGVCKEIIVLNDSSFDVFVKVLDPKMVLFDRFMTEEQFGWRVAEQCPEAIRILDMEDLHCLREARREAIKQDKTTEEADVFTDLAKREIASILRSDLSLVISEYEQEVLENRFRVDPRLLCYWPLTVDVSSLSMDLPSFDDRKDLVFIGNFLHEPNWDAVRYLKSTVWPLLRQELPEASLRIAGAYPSQKVWDLHNPNERFLVEGRAESVSDVFLQARILIAPLRFGAGIKGKLLEAMMYGLPSVTTSTGIEGMAAAGEWNGLVADDAVSFATGVKDLYRQKDLWEVSQQKGFDILRKRFDRKTYHEMIVKRLGDLQRHYMMYRKENFIGTLLWHHSALSTKYMALWIEAKNRLK